ncbi:tail length tape measure protein [Ralstonia phage PQ43W]
MSNAGVVDELIVKLTLDADEYKKVDKKVDQHVTRTQKKREQDDRKTKKRETEQIKRNKETTQSVKTLGAALKGLATTVGAVLGVGGAAGIVGAVVALAGMETNLRRAAVSTGMSNREMQAWGATARRLGADAQSGASSIADLAREQQQFNLTGNAPTMQALARMGVRVSPDASIGDMLGQAQQIYRQAAPAQQKQIESGLAAQGVTPDLILMIKSETDAREAYTKSLGEAAEENRAALNAVYDSLSAVGSAALNVANTLATALQPYIEEFAQWVSSGSQKLSAFNDRVLAAGGGMDGFIRVMREDFPAATDAVVTGLRTMGEIIDVVVYGYQQLWGALKDLWGWIKGLGGPTDKEGVGTVGQAIGTVGDAISWAWKALVADARQHGAAPIASLTNAPAPAPAPPPAGGGAAPASPARAQLVGANDLMARLITQYGLSVPQAAAVAANFQRESSLNTASVNPAGGGTGARGLANWRGARTQAFVKQFGVTPDKGTLDQQLQFMMSDPYERGLLQKALGKGGDAQVLGASFSDVFEGHGNMAESLKRGRLAQQLATGYAGPTAQSGGTNSTGATFNIQTVNVKADKPDDFVGGIQRVTGVQNYQAAVR